MLLYLAKITFGIALLILILEEIDNRFFKYQYNIIKHGDDQIITGGGLTIYHLGSTFDMNLCLLNK